MLWNHLWSGSWLLCKSFPWLIHVIYVQLKSVQAIVKFHVNKMTINHKYLLSEQRFTLYNLKPLSSNYHEDEYCKGRLVCNVMMNYSPSETTPDNLRLQRLRVSNVSDVQFLWNEKKGGSTVPVFQANCNLVCRMSPPPHSAASFPSHFYRHTHSHSHTQPELAEARAQLNGADASDLRRAGYFLHIFITFIKIVPPEQYNFAPPKTQEDIFKMGNFFGKNIFTASGKNVF